MIFPSFEGTLLLTLGVSAEDREYRAPPPVCLAIPRRARDWGLGSSARTGPGPEPDLPCAYQVHQDQPAGSAHAA